MTRPDDGDELAAHLDRTRLVVEADDAGARLHGTPVTLQFDERVSPATVAETISEPAAPWHTFGVTRRLDDGYEKVALVLLPREEEPRSITSQATCEIAPTFARLYIREEASAERTAAFIREMDREWPLTAVFAPPEPEPEPVEVTP